LLAGYECACQINQQGERLDMIAGLQHDQQAASDYALLSQVDIRTLAMACAGIG